MDSLLKKAEKLNHLRRQKTALHRLVHFLSFFVVFCTTYALILPAITQERETFCGMNEHKHDEACYIRNAEDAVYVLDCTYETLGVHVHGPDCLDEQGRVLCNQADYVVHTHGELCVDESGTVICALPEHASHVHTEPCSGMVGGHCHTDECYGFERGTLTCQLPETAGHVHTEECYTQGLLLCTLEDNHAHSETCYQEGELVCTQAEGHIHERDCYEQSLTCQLTEQAAHTHEDTCYESAQILIFKEPESDGELALICTISNETVHIHDESCFRAIYDDTLTCTLTEGDGHVHGERCYGHWEMNCTMPEHTHGLLCWSNPAADVETEDVWMRSFAGIELSGEWAADAFAIAESQFGYAESIHNYVVEPDGVNIRGYTRYGDWYGDDYGDWCAMFASFCLHYAQVEDFPLQANCEQWIRELSHEDMNLYHPVDSGYEPVTGDLVFFDQDENGVADHVGFVAEVLEATAEEPEKIKTLEGNCADRVQYASYERADATILGYGMIPEAPEDETYTGDTLPQKPNYACGLEEHAHSAECLNEFDECICGLDEHVHSEACQEILVEETVVYYCGLEEYTHRDECYDEAGELICGFAEHTHDLFCEVDLTALNPEEQALVTSVIQQIEELPSADEIDARIEEFEAAEDYDGEEAWLSEVYQLVAHAYHDYSQLPEEQQELVLNRDKLLEMEYIWSAVILADRAYVWLDGTNGGIMSLEGADNMLFPGNIFVGNTITLPETWNGPAKYDYTLRGWYDVKQGEYYAPGSEFTVRESTVLYADWAASTYNVGQFNEKVSDTISTNEFITTRVFDYSTMFNMYSLRSNVTVSSSGHKETWTLATSGKGVHGTDTLKYIFLDYDSGGDISYPSGNTSANQSQSDPTTGLYNEDLAYRLFDPNSSYNPATGEGILGKQYIGTADHLYHYGTDPSDTAHFGYYYYDSKYNAASYNQRDQRFYVYDYLERTSDSYKDGELKGGTSPGSYSDFLPFNSPYIVPADHPYREYSYHGERNEYVGTTHYMYDAKYNGQESLSSKAGTNYWFGMSSEIEFYLPNQPGTTDHEGNKANLSLYGDDMIFEFSGDDDVWVLVDGDLALDIGGMHGVESGRINFSTGVVTVNEVEQNSYSAKIKALSSGHHVLTLYYLERGSSQSNCSIRFNITSRYNLTIQKEDVLSRELLNGAEFAVFMDRDLTEPAELWTSYEAYQNNEASTNVFVVDDGSTTMWGFSPGHSYYFKEIKGPDREGYEASRGLIVLTLNNHGTASYEIVVEKSEEDDIDISNGFTVHGFTIDQETMEAFMVITNGKNIEETTKVSVTKKWNDTLDHSGDAVTVYLLADNVRIRQETLTQAGNWTHTWSNIPKYRADGVTPIVYTVQEGTVPGYTGVVESIHEYTTEAISWENASNFTNGGVYLLKTSNGYLSAADGKLSWVTDEAQVKASPNAQWTASVGTNRLNLTNGTGQKLYYSNNTFLVSENASTGTNITFNSGRISSNSRYFRSISDGVGQTSWNSSNALTFSLSKQTVSTTTVPVEAGTIAYRITNTPAEEEELISLAVRKDWVPGNMGSEEMYKYLTVTVELLADGEGTGRSVKLNLQKGWQDSFDDLPRYDADGNEIVYSVREISLSDDWQVSYSELTPVEGEENSYRITVTNTYSQVYNLPKTGGLGLHWCYLFGVLFSTCALIGLLRRRRCQ